METKILTSVISTLGLLLMSQQGIAATTNLDFAGGCTGIDDQKGTLCDNNGQPTEANIAAILGVTEADVTEIFHFDTNTGPITGIDGTSGTWNLGTNPDGITHLSFKADGYFVLAAITANNGDWMMANPVTTWGTNVSLPCPVSICSNGPRAYVDDDFLNDGGQVANLSNFRGYTVVPVPAAVWLFGSGLLGLVGIARRKKA